MLDKVKKVLTSYIPAFALGILSIVFGKSLLSNNRRGADTVGADFDEARAGLEDSIGRTAGALEANRTAQDILRQVRERGKFE